MLETFQFDRHRLLIVWHVNLFSFIHSFKIGELFKTKMTDLKSDMMNNAKEMKSEIANNAKEMKSEIANSAKEIKSDMAKKN